MTDTPEPAVTLILHTDGRAELSVADGVDDAALAAYLHQTADLVATGVHREACTTCADHQSHDHHDDDG